MLVVVVYCYVFVCYFTGQIGIKKKEVFLAFHGGNMIIISVCMRILNKYLRIFSFFSQMVFKSPYALLERRFSFTISIGR